MNYKIEKDSGSCRFEEWKKDKKELGLCGCETNVKVGHNWICLNHLPHVMLTDNKPEMRTSTGGIVKFKEDFLAIVNGQKIIDKQMELF